MIAPLLALALAGTPSSTPASSAPPIEVIEAGQIEYDASLDRTVVTGGVVLKRGEVTLRADSAIYDEKTGEVDAKGGVLLLEPGRAAFADSMHAVIDGPYAARDVVAFLKDAPLDLSRCRTLDEAKSSGRNRVSFGGRKVTGESEEPGFDVDRARITLCDCGAGPPSWQVRARHASVVPGDHAWLTFPILYVTPRFLFIDKPIPVMALPVLYLPLGDRQTGLLMPDVVPMSPNGVIVSQPLFLALGRSYDATIIPNYTFGPNRNKDGTYPQGVKGFGATLELRWVPSQVAAGRLRVFFNHSEISTWPSDVYRPPGMNRLALSGEHEQAFSDRTHLKLELGLVSDPLYLDNFTGDALLRSTQYRRSAIAVTHRTDDLLLEGHADYLLALQNLRSGTSTPAPFGLFGTSLKTLHRLPSASLSLMPLRLVGPLHFAATVGVARFAPLSGHTGDEGADGIGPGEAGWPTAAHPAFDAGEGDGRWQASERVAATRALVRAELRAPMSAGRALSVEPWVAGTAAGYVFEVGPAPLLDAHAAGGLTLSTDLSRTFGALRHRIQPQLALVAGTAQVGRTLPNYAYDEFDVAAPLAPATPTVPQRRTLTALPGSFQQMQLSVRNRFLMPGLSAELSLGQDVDVGHGRLSETWAQGRLWKGLPFGVLTADATARFYAFGAKRAAGSGPASTALPPSRFFDAFTLLTANVTLGDHRGDNVHAGLLAVGAGGSPRLLAGLEPIFDPRPMAMDAVATGSAGLVAKLAGAALTYDAYFYARSQPKPACEGKSTGPHVYQHNLSLVWDSPCRCWRAGITLTMNECEAKPRLGFVFDLSSLSERRVAF